jgi:hypothetical protein
MRHCMICFKLYQPIPNSRCCKYCVDKGLSGSSRGHLLQHINGIFTVPKKISSPSKKDFNYMIICSYICNVISHHLYEDPGTLLQPYNPKPRRAFAFRANRECFLFVLIYEGILIYSSFLSLFTKWKWQVIQVLCSWDFRLA